MAIKKRILVTGAGGFIGHHLTKYLVEHGHWVRGVDIKEPEYEPTAADDFQILDLRYWENCVAAVRGVDEVYALAANMGGIGFIETNKAVIVRDNTLINLHTIEAARHSGVKRFLYTSSACIYPGYLQRTAEVAALKEDDAYPADAEDGYGWEKLYMERTCRHYTEDFGLETRTVRFHNIYGPLGTYDGGREKSPAAICRKIALAKDVDTIEVWGDGEQTRSYCYIDDCVEGIYRLMESDYRAPLNLGTDRLISINELVDLVAAGARKTIRKAYDLTKPQGVRGRNSDNTRLRNVLGWEPSTTLEVGLANTYKWIAGELEKSHGRPRTETELPLMGLEKLNPMLLFDDPIARLRPTGPTADHRPSSPEP
jgi:GDP-D-mannose 3',5'-epimerase